MSGFLGLPFMSGGSGGSVTIQVAASRAVDLPADVRTIEYSSEEVVVSDTQLWSVQGRVLTLLPEDRQIMAAGETRLIVLGTQTRTVLAQGE